MAILLVKQSSGLESVSPTVSHTVIKLPFLTFSAKKPMIMYLCNSNAFFAHLGQTLEEISLVWHIVLNNT